MGHGHVRCMCSLGEGGNPPDAGGVSEPALVGWHWMPHGVKWASLVAQLAKNPSAMRETWVQSLGWEDSLEKGKATHSSILAWRIPWIIQSMGSQRVGYNFNTIYLCKSS